MKILILEVEELKPYLESVLSKEIEENCLDIPFTDSFAFKKKLLNMLIGNLYDHIATVDEDTEEAAQLENAIRIIESYVKHDQTVLKMEFINPDGAIQLIIGGG